MSNFLIGFLQRESNWKGEISLLCKTVLVLSKAMSEEL